MSAAKKDNHMLVDVYLMQRNLQRDIVLQCHVQDLNFSSRLDEKETTLERLITDKLALLSGIRHQL